jgi:LuxR family maltose regulon positive regulatory protein
MNAHDARPAALLQQLDAGMDHLLTLVVAPAGAGKSTLLRRWLAARGWPAAWVALDVADNQPARFVQHLAAASRAMAPELAEVVALARRTAAGPLAGEPAAAEDALAAWLNAAAGLEQDFCLVLDGYERIEAPAVHDAVRLLLDYPPPHMHLYIAARAEPPLQLPRLRVRRQLLEVRLA